MNGKGAVSSAVGFAAQRGGLEWTRSDQWFGVLSLNLCAFQRRIALHSLFLIDMKTNLPKVTNPGPPDPTGEDEIQQKIRVQDSNRLRFI